MYKDFYYYSGASKFNDFLLVRINNELSNR